MNESRDRLRGAIEVTSAARVSIHGGHSKEFGDANDSSLEEVVRAYADKGFKWVGITEHIPPASADFLFPQEIEAGQTLESRMERFTEYFSVARRLQKKYRVGSVHHVRDICIDGLPEWYAQAVEEAGGIDALFCDYFDQQYELVEELEPEVVGHFDLIRMHDRDYRQRLEIPKIKKRIRRNLEKIKALGSILDFNLRAFEKGGSEPYVSKSILEMALELGVPCVPGDDSHSYWRMVP